MKELNELCKLYKRNKLKYSSNDNKLLEYGQRKYNEYEIDLAYNLLDNNYYIFIIVERGNKLIFKGLYLKDSNKLSNDYDVLKNDLYSLSFEDFIKKNYLVLKDNFLN